MNEKGYIAKKLANGGSSSSGRSYTGLATKTATVTVDNAAATIKVDIPAATAENYGVVKLGNSFVLNESDQLSFSESYIDDIVNNISDNSIQINKLDLENVIINANNLDI